MSARRSSLALLVGLAAISCSSTGGTILGLFPAPKILDGDVEGDRYIAPGEVFSVALPHAPGSYEYQYMAIKETRSGGETYVSFGPAALDRSIYRVSATPIPDGGTFVLDEIMAGVLEGMEATYEHEYGSPVACIHRGSSVVSGSPAKYGVLRQEIPSRRQGGSQTSQETLYQAMVLFELDRHIVVVGVEIPDGMLESERLEQALLANDYKPLSRMAESLRIAAAE